METTLTTEPTLLEQAEAKQKQLEQALSLLDRIGADIDWALDFSEHESINEALNPVSYAISEAHDEIEEEYEKLTEAVNKYEEEKEMALHNVDSETDLKYYLD
jgi:archaellum component FlaC